MKKNVKKRKKKKKANGIAPQPGQIGFGSAWR